MKAIEIVKYVIMAIYAVVCFVLIFLIMKQNKEASGVSSTVIGASANNFYEKNKGKTTEGKMKTATIVLGITFVILTFALGIIYVV